MASAALRGRWLFQCHFHVLETDNAPRRFHADVRPLFEDPNLANRAVKNRARIDSGLSSVMGVCDFDLKVTKKKGMRYSWRHNVGRVRLMEVRIVLNLIAQGIVFVDRVGVLSISLILSRLI